MFTNRTSKLAAAVALNILAEALTDRPAAAPAAQPSSLPANMPLGFVEYSRSEHAYSDDFRTRNQTRDAVTVIERALPWDGDMSLKALKQLLRDIDSNVTRDTWSALALCTGVMCIPGQIRECVKVVYVLADGTTRSATWFKQ